MLSVRLSSETKVKLRQIAELKGLTLSEVHRQALVEYCEREMKEKKTSRYDDIIGIGEGPSDLARRSKEIFGEIMDEKYRRHAD